MSKKTNPQIDQMLSQLETLTDSKELLQILYIDSILPNNYKTQESISILLSIIEKKIFGLHHGTKHEYTINEAFELGLLYWLVVFVCDYSISNNLLDPKIEKIINLEASLDEAISILRYLYLERKFVFALQILATHPFLSKDYNESLTKIRDKNNNKQFNLTLVSNTFSQSPIK